MAHLDLIAAPAVHAQRLDFGDVGAELAVQSGASHAEEYAQLLGSVWTDANGNNGTDTPTGPTYEESA
jgi:hypothetical protein